MWGWGGEGAWDSEVAKPSRTPVGNDGKLAGLSGQGGFSEATEGRDVSAI